MDLNKYNPFQLHQTSIAPQVLLMVKLLTIGLLGKGYFQTLPEPFLPFFSFFDALPATGFQLTMKFLFAIAAIMLMTNQKVRLSCLIIGCVFLISTLASKAYYSNGKFYCGLVYLLTALDTNKDRPLLLQYQIIIVYFGSGLNKLLELDWRTGQYFDHWLINVRQSPIYLLLIEYIPSAWLSLMLSWCTIILELIVLPVLLFFKKWHRIGVWLGIGFHSMAFWLSGLSFGIFFPGMLATYLVFAELPDKISIFGAKRYQISSLLHRILNPFNGSYWDSINENNTQQANKGGLIIDFYNVNSGFAYVKSLANMLIYNPLFYTVLMLLFSLTFLPNFTQHLAALAVLVFFFPFYNQIYARFTKKP